MCYNLFVIVQSKYGRVAQLGERTVRIRKVEGSIPFMSTKNCRGESCGSFLFADQNDIERAPAYAGALRLS